MAMINPTFISDHAKHSTFSFRNIIQIINDKTLIPEGKL
jgi:hypothetical protein